MNTITRLAVTALGLATTTLANAAVYNSTWESTAPTKASYTITLSGECSGKITQDIDTVTINRRYETNGSGQIIRDTSSQSVDIEGVSYGSDYFYTEVQGSNDASTDKFSETIAKGKKTVSFTLTTSNNAYPRVWPISDENQFASQIKCKGGKTLSEVLDGWSLYINSSDTAYKTKTTVKLVSSLNNPLEAQYTVKQTFSGIADQGSLCTNKGEVGTEPSSVRCAQPKPVKVSVQINAQGTAYIAL